MRPTETDSAPRPSTLTRPGSLPQRVASPQTKPPLQRAHSPSPLRLMRNLSFRRIESRVLEVVNKRRNLDPYARIFPGNLEGALSPAGRAQAAFAAQVADLIAPASGPRATGVTDEIASFAPELREKTATLLARIASVEAAEAAASAAYGAELTCRRQWREQYRRSHALLTLLYPTDRRKVESFFKPTKRSKKKAAAQGAI